MRFLNNWIPTSCLRSHNRKRNAPTLVWIKLMISAASLAPNCFHNVGPRIMHTATHIQAEATGGMFGSVGIHHEHRVPRAVAPTLRPV